MKKLLLVLALATSVAVVSAQEPKQEVKKEACCKKMANHKEGDKMKCSKDCTMPCCKKEAKKKG
ncbi:MAG: hypothetical protein ACKOW2_01495 [Sphingobacteriaceae bacterium]